MNTKMGRPAIRLSNLKRAPEVRKERLVGNRETPLAHCMASYFIEDLQKNHLGRRMLAQIRKLHGIAHSLSRGVQEIGR
jgi:hypothetical protein